MNNLIPVHEFVKAFFGSERTARRHRAQGKWPAYIRVGRRIFLRKEAVDAWFAKNETDGSAS